MLSLVKIAQIVMECFKQLTVRTIKALFSGAADRDIVTIPERCAPTV